MNLFERADQLAALTSDALHHSKMVFGLSSERNWWREMKVQVRCFVRTDAEGNEIYFVTRSWADIGDRVELNVLYRYFRALPNFEAVLHDLIYDHEPLYEMRSVHGPPAYVFCNIDFMADHFKPLFRQHLEKELSGYADDYLKKHFSAEDWERVEFWREILEEGSGDSRS
jgi:hypothetical protein